MLGVLAAAAAAASCSYLSTRLQDGNESVNSQKQLREGVRGSSEGVLARKDPSL